MSNDSKAKYDGKCKLGGNKIDGNKVRNNEVKTKDQKTFKSKKLSKSTKIVGFLDFFISQARLAFTKLIQVFIIVPIIYYFNLEYHVWNEINVL